MKNIKELNNSKSPVAVYEERLDKYEQIPLFQEKMAKSNAILENYPPLAFLKKKNQQRVKTYFEQQMPVEYIAQQLDLSEIEVLTHLEEMALNEAIS